METKKCVDKLFTLRAKIAGKSKAEQLRAVSQRMITDLEMNSTYRGAVEIFNLCCKLDPKDVLNAECVRTFASFVFDGRPWMHRLESSQKSMDMKEIGFTTYVPASRKANVRTDRANVKELLAYGYRPLEEPWKLLPAYEFHQQWRCETL